MGKQGIIHPSLYKVVGVVHSVIVCLVVPQAVLIVTCGLCLQMKFHRTLIAESCQADVVSDDVRHYLLVAWLWPSSLGSILAVRNLCAITAPGLLCSGVCQQNKCFLLPHSGVAYILRVWVDLTLY